MIDLHSHLLPNLDDGSDSVTRSVEVLRDFAGEGIEGVVLTPHLRASEIVRHGEEHVRRRERAFELLTSAAPRRASTAGTEATAGTAGTAEAAAVWPALYLGFEILLDEPLPVAALDRRYSLAGSRHYLVEFQLEVPAELATRELERIVADGVVPLVAHPERYDACSVETVAGWRKAGARVQVDATTLLRPTPRGRRARALLAAGTADVLAADNHGDGRSIAAARRYLEEQGHQEAARRLTVTNPVAVVEGREMVPVPPVEVSESILTKVRRLFE